MTSNNTILPPPPVSGMENFYAQSSPPSLFPYVGMNFGRLPPAPEASYQNLDDDTPIEPDDFFKIVVVLDESGSMHSIKENMRTSLNQLITEQKTITERPSKFTLVKFNEHVRRVIQNKLLDEVELLQENDYKPDGGTALFDAVGDTINWFRNEKNVLMIVVTDGQENSSRKYTNKKQITDTVAKMQNEQGWNYVYLSCDIATAEQGNNMGFATSTTSSNKVVRQEDFGQFISLQLNSAISTSRKSNVPVSSQLNHLSL